MEREIEGTHGDLYDNVRESLLNELYRLQRLQKEGLATEEYEEELFERIKNLIEFEANRKLENLRKEIKDYQKKEKYEHHWTRDELENL